MSASYGSRRGLECPGRIIPPSSSSPSINKLPDELHLAIFLLLVRNNKSRKDTNSRTQRMRYPWTTAAVCGRWRKICLDNGILWSYVKLEDHNCLKQAYDSAAVLRTWTQIDRSQNVPLTVNAQVWCGCNSIISQFKVLMGHSARWQHALIYGSTSQDNSNAPELTELIPPIAAFTHLHALEICFPDPADSHLLSELFNDHSSLINLRSARFRNLIPNPATPFPFEQLTSLALDQDHGNLDEMLLLLSRCQNLTHLKTTNGLRIQDAEGSSIARHSVTLPCLGTWTSQIMRTDINNGCFDLLVRYLRLPSLHTMKLVDGDLPGSLSADIAHLLRESNATIKTLEIGPLSRQDYDTVLPLLQQCPHLESLAIVGEFAVFGGFNDSCDDILSTLMDVTSAGPLCRRLKNLEFHQVQFDPVTLVQIIKSRYSGVDAGDCDAIQSVQMKFYDDDDSRSRKFFDYCRTILEARLKGDASMGPFLEFFFGES